MTNSYPVRRGATAYPLNLRIDNISSASKAYLAPGLRGKIVDIYCVISGAISTADATLTAKISGTPVNGGAITVPTAESAAGNVYSAKPSGANTFIESDNIEIETDGASSKSVRANITIWIETSLRS